MKDTTLSGVCFCIGDKNLELQAFGSSKLIARFRVLQELDLDKQDDDAVLQFQRLLFRYWPSLRDVALTNCASARKPLTLQAAFSSLSLPELQRLASTQLRLVAADDSDAEDSSYLRDAIIARYASAPRPKAAIAAMPLYPTETLLWDENQIPDIHYTGEACLALPKLNLQFLTFWDYLLRNFHLFRLEAAYEIREDVGDVLKVRRRRHPELLDACSAHAAAMQIQ